MVIFQVEGMEYFTEISFITFADLKREIKSFSSCNHKDRERIYSVSITEKQIQNKGKTLLPGCINISSNTVPKKRKKSLQGIVKWQLSLPEHRLQELKARSSMHISWIFIPAIISLSLLASQVHKRHRHAERGFH